MGDQAGADAVLSAGDVLGIAVGGGSAVFDQSTNVLLIDSGGGSYIDGTGVDQVLAAGVWTGDGLVTLQFDPRAVPNPEPGPSCWRASRRRRRSPPLKRRRRPAPGCVDVCRLISDGPLDLRADATGLRVTAAL